MVPADSARVEEALADAAAAVAVDVVVGALQRYEAGLAPLGELLTELAFAGREVERVLLAAEYPFFLRRKPRRPPLGAHRKGGPQ